MSGPEVSTEQPATDQPPGGAPLLRRLRRLRWVVAVLATVTLVQGWVLAGCGPDDYVRWFANVEDVSQETRDHMDILADRLGTPKGIRMNDLTVCNSSLPGPEIGEMLLYTREVAIGPGTLDRARSEIIDQYRLDGWHAEIRFVTNVVFRRDGITMGVMIYEEEGRAVVQGTGPCVKGGRLGST